VFACSFSSSWVVRSEPRGEDAVGDRRSAWTRRRTSRWADAGQGQAAAEAERLPRVPCVAEATTLFCGCTGGSGIGKCPFISINLIKIYYFEISLYALQSGIEGIYKGVNSREMRL
uniref:Uncharacterized protein n=1 Tax=Triticum urartu TaxID=4572 RepID=A0A8R7UM15_TRIUA